MNITIFQVLFPCLFAGLLGLVAQNVHAGDSQPKPFLTGVDANFSLDMEKQGMKWTWEGRTNDLFEEMAKRGISDVRVRLWTKEDSLYGRTNAMEVVKRAIRAGLNPYLVLFLSDDWADLMKQPAPAKWKGLSLAERATAIQAYSRDIVTHFRKAGLRSHLYGIGNEIDFGVCGEYPGQESEKAVNSLREHVWPRAAKLILASEAGVKTADPEARFMLHIAHWWDADFCVAFYRFMLDQGVQIDYAGLSYYPSSNMGGSLTMEQFGVTVSRLAKAIARPVIVPETAYPGSSDFEGQFATWKHEVPGYPLTPEGQRHWLADFLAWCRHNPDIHGVYYWSPEWYCEGVWKGFALFDPKGQARPAWTAFSEVSAEHKSQE